jgi:hypothetical protein
MDNSVKHLLEFGRINWPVILPWSCSAWPRYSMRGGRALGARAPLNPAYYPFQYSK